MHRTRRKRTTGANVLCLCVHARVSLCLCSEWKSLTDSSPFVCIMVLSVTSTAPSHNAARHACVCSGRRSRADDDEGNGAIGHHHCTPLLMNDEIELFDSPAARGRTIAIVCLCACVWLVFGSRSVGRTVHFPSHDIVQVFPVCVCVCVCVRAFFLFCCFWPIVFA